MKLLITPVALAVTMALGAAAAQAQTLPSYSGTTSATPTGLYLAVWDDSTDNAEIVNLSADISDISLVQGATTLTTPTSAFSTVHNFDGYGTVLQYNVGTVSNFSTVFPSVSGNTEYMVMAQLTSGSDAEALVSSAMGSNNSLLAAAVTVMANSITAEQSDWSLNDNVSPAIDIAKNDAAGVAAYNPTGSNNALQDGELGLSAGNYFGTNVGTAAQFYDYTGGQRGATFNETAYSYDGNLGFWSLSSTGDLTWNLVTASTVPLPPAVWLFASGLLGLGLIGRRRQSGLGAAA